MSFDLTREQMIACIAESWACRISIEDLIRQQLDEYTEELDSWFDDDIEEEYKNIFGDYEQEERN